MLSKTVFQTAWRLFGFRITAKYKVFIGNVITVTTRIPVKVYLV